MAGELARHLSEQRIANGMAVAVVDALEAVEVEEDERRLGAVTRDIGKRALEFAVEAAAVEDVGERIDIGARLELGDPPFGVEQFCLEPRRFQPAGPRALPPRPRAFPVSAAFWSRRLKSLSVPWFYQSTAFALLVVNANL